MIGLAWLNDSLPRFDQVKTWNYDNLMTVKRIKYQL
jgi:hypothetical protein